MRSRLIILGVAVVVVIAAIVASSGGGGSGGSGGGGGGAGSTAPKGALAVSVVYSPEKEKLLTPLILPGGLLVIFDRRADA